MARLTDYTSYADAQAHANSGALWELFDGDREHINIAHEAITRHADGSGICLGSLQQMRRNKHERTQILAGGCDQAGGMSDLQGAFAQGDRVAIAYLC